MSLRVAITRALPEAEETAARIRAYGGTPVLAPLLTIVPMGYDTAVDGAQALLFTSAAGVRAFPDARRMQAMPVLCVGNATADAARSAGFIDVRSANGDAEDLVALARASLDPIGARLIHIRGTHVASDVAGVLSAAGFSVESRIAYTAVQASALPPAFSELLDVVLFYSARAAAAFAALGAPGVERLTAGCLSRNVAAAAGSGWRRVIVAERPREDALLDAIFAG